MHRRGNLLRSGSTQSGKSYAEVHEVLAAAADPNLAIVVIDPHPRSLAWNCFKHLISRGHERRIIWDSLDELTHVPKYQFLTRSNAKGDLERANAHYQMAEQFAELLGRRRDVASLTTSPQTEEWTIKAILLLLHQPRGLPASDLRYVFKVGHPRFEQLIEACLDEDLRYDFARIASGEIRAGQFAAAARLIHAVCDAPAFIARCGMKLNIGRALEQKQILLIQGGATSQPVLQTILGSIILQTIQYVRTRSSAWPRVLLVLDEATNANLVGAAGHEVRALAECQKMGLDIHILVQSLNFPSPYITDGVLTNCIRHEWLYAANAAVARKAADDLGDPELESTIRTLKVGERYVKERDRIAFQRVPLLEEPWVFPELANRKISKALDRIRNRPEYGGTDECPPGTTATPPSSGSPPDTSAAAVTSSDSSPARRRRTGGSRSSKPKDSSDS